MKLSNEQIATISHDVNKAYCESLGDDSQLPWSDSSDEQKKITLDGVLLHKSNPEVTPEQSHENWMKKKIEAGWKYGEVKNQNTKEHPSLVPYNDLPIDQKAKDFIFRQIILSLSDNF